MNAYEVALHQDAERDLEEIFDYIASEAGPRIAEAYLDRLQARLKTLSTTPMRGTARPELGAGCRTFGFERRATIVIRVERSAKRVIVVGVFYGGRLVERSWLVVLQPINKLQPQVLRRTVGIQRFVGTSSRPGHLRLEPEHITVLINR